MTLPAALVEGLRVPGQLTIALSGGIDSLTLSAAAAQVRARAGLLLCHAVSPAVPQEATSRVRSFAERYRIPLKVVDAGEFADQNYRANPVNRCYFCKSNLYRSLSRMGDRVAAGTNLDDLSDYRPGLEAARERGVLHPFVDAEMGKQEVRMLARQLGLGELADLPSAPCLASRVETGLRVEPADLLMIDRAETRLRGRLGQITLRCRKLHQGWMIELDPATLAGLDRAARADLIALADLPGSMPARLGPYRRGRAFVHDAREPT